MECPILDRKVTLQLMGDWGYANLHRACGWLGSQVVVRSAPGSRAGVWNGDGWLANVRAVAHGAVDAAFVTPALLARLAIDGRGPFAGRPLPGLRALGRLPQFDRLVFAVHSDLVVQRVHLGTKQAHGLAVDLHAAIENELFGCAPGGNAGVGQEFSKANGQIVLTR